MKKDIDNELFKAVKEASISVSCLLDDVEVDKIGKFCPYLITDLKHIQDEITIIENELKEKA